MFAGEHSKRGIYSVATYYEPFFFFEDDDDEVGDDEDEDDGFFVPHGYLSEDEGVTEVRGERGGDCPGESSLSRAGLRVWGCDSGVTAQLTHPHPMHALRPQHVVICGVSGLSLSFAWGG